MTNHTICQLFPSNTEAAGIHPERNFSYCVLPKHKRELSLKMTVGDWTQKECNGCEHNKIWADRSRSISPDDFLDENPLACSGFSEMHYRGAGSCKKGLVAARETKVTVEVQRSLWTAGTGHYPYVFQVDQKRAIVHALASPNVYSEGKICWGGNRIPNRLNVIVNRFFGSPFNTDILFGEGDTKPEQFQNTFFLHRSWDSDDDDGVSGNYTDTRTYKPFNTSFSYDGVILTSNPKILDQLPSHCIKDFYGTRKAVGWGVFSREKNCYFVRFKDLSATPNSEMDCIAKKKRMSGSSKVTVLGYAESHGHLVTDLLYVKEMGLSQELPNEEEESNEN